MGWFFLLIAGLLETLWAGLLKSLSGEVDPARLLALVLSMGASLWFLGLSMRGLPVSVAYPVWTGIGSAGAVVVGVAFFGEAVSLRVVAGVGLLCLGMVLIASDSV